MTSCGRIWGRTRPPFWTKLVLKWGYQKYLGCFRYWASQCRGLGHQMRCYLYTSTGPSTLLRHIAIVCLQIQIMVNKFRKIIFYSVVLLLSMFRPTLNYVNDNMYNLNSVGLYFRFPVLLNYRTHKQINDRNIISPITTYIYIKKTSNFKSETGT